MLNAVIKQYRLHVLVPNCKFRQYVFSVQFVKLLRLTICGTSSRQAIP